MGKYQPSTVESAAQREQILAARQEKEIAKEQWEMARPMYRYLAAEAQKPVEQQTYFKRMIGQLENQYGNIGGEMRRTLAGRYQYGSGYEGAAAKNLELSRAGARAGAWQAGEEARQGMLLNLAGGGRQAAQQGYASSGGMYSDVASRLANLRATKAGQQTSAACCWMFAMGEKLTEDVRNFRDIFFPKESVIGKGYKLMSTAIVPLMKKSKAVTAIMNAICLNPLKACAEYHFGKNDYGIWFAPVGFFWVGLWAGIGATIGQCVDVESIDVEFSARPLAA